MVACWDTTVEEKPVAALFGIHYQWSSTRGSKNYMINTLTTAIVFLIVIQTRSPLYTAVNKNEYHQLDWVHDITGNNTSHW